jgi:hypothetical protein
MLQEALFAMQKANSVRRITAELTLVRMCDERLNSSPEAMLVRIANMESNLATGNFAAPAAVSVNEMPASPSPAKAEITEAQKPSRPARRQAFSDDDDDEMFRGDAPGAKATSVTPQKTVAEPKAEAKAAPVSVASQTDANVRVLKPFRSRAEVIEKLEATRAGSMTASFFKRAKWYTDGNGKIVLKFETEFDIKNMQFFDGEEVFLKVVSGVIGRQLTKADLSCECDEKKTNDSVIDQILEAAEND